LIASVYIKNGNIHFYNEKDGLSNLGGIAYELGRPLLNFVCYEPERFDEGYALVAEAFDHEFAYLSVRKTEFIAGLKERANEFQQQETYLSFYDQTFMQFICAFTQSPREAVQQLAELFPGAEEKLGWTMDFAWPPSPPGYFYADKERRLYRAALDVVSLMSEDLREKLKFMTNEIELLINFRTAMGASVDSPMEYLYSMEAYRFEKTDRYFYLENPLRSFYGITKPPEVVELYEINSIVDLFRFEFVKMIEHDVFIKKCKNCGRYFIPRRRADAEYCDRTFGDGGRKCSEVGATLRYEKKVAENPVLEAYAKAYKRFNSRTRTKKMTQSEFLSWSEQARKRRDECLAGELPFEEFVAWLEQGRLRRRAGKSASNPIDPASE